MLNYCDSATLMQHILNHFEKQGTFIGVNNPLIYLFWKLDFFWTHLILFQVAHPWIEILHMYKSIKLCIMEVDETSFGVLCDSTHEI